MSLLSMLIKKDKILMAVTSFSYLASLIASVSLGNTFLSTKTPISLFNIFYLDSLSVFFVFTISVIVFAATLYSEGYIEKELSHNEFTQDKLKYYYLLLNLFVFAILLVTVVNNLGMMWVAIEITTLISAFLVGFHNTKNSIEAAWKYIIICSVGIILALLGTILFSYAFLFSVGTKSLNWTDLIAVASKLDPNLVKIAFIFVMVGYGTKAGLAPMHTWLPDAHSQALSPISGLLSGVLLKTSIYAILRYTMIANRCLGISFSSHLFLLFGLLSMALAAGLILVQRDLKRLLAYSSIEHVGIIVFGLGIGGPLGLYGALLHIFNHAVTKSFLFFGAGNLVNTYGSHNIRNMKGALKVIPFTGGMVLIGIFALAGFPPFSIFYSEIMILMSTFNQGRFILGALFSIFVTIVFGAIIFYFSQIIFGEKPKNLQVVREPLIGKLSFLFLLVFIIFAGFMTPNLINGLILSIIEALKG